MHTIYVTFLWTDDNDAAVSSGSGTPDDKDDDYWTMIDDEDFIEGTERCRLLCFLAYLLFIFLFHFHHLVLTH